MEANEFIRKFGLFTAKEYLAGSTIFDNHLMVFTNDCELNRLVESHELVELYGGLESAKKCLLLAPYATDLEGSVDALNQAIILVESTL